MARRRHWRTIFLALVACATFAWSAVYQFDVEPAVLLEILLMSVSLVGLAMLAAVLALFIRALFKPRD